MDLPIDADVQCTDGASGRSTYVIVNPTTRAVTHLVVREGEWPHTERLVPVELVVDTTADTIRLNCTRDHVVTMERFIQTEFVAEAFINPASPGAAPYTTLMPKEYHEVPAGELALQRGAHIVATDGYVGRVDEFLVDPADDHITHLILREGHRWAPKEITVPVAAIARIEENAVYLKLDKRQIDELPVAALHEGRRGDSGHVPAVQESGSAESVVSTSNDSNERFH
jgi:uncharacterized protein YrrD